MHSELSQCDCGTSARIPAVAREWRCICGAIRWRSAAGWCLVATETRRGKPVISKGRKPCGCQERKQVDGQPAT